MFQGKLLKVKPLNSNKKVLISAYLENYNIWYFETKDVLFLRCLI